MGIMGNLLVAMRRTFVIGLFLTVFTLGAQTPPSSGENTLRLLSPGTLGSGLSVTQAQRPSDGRINPAVAAVFQRTILELNYTALAGTGEAPGLGHAATAAMAFPTRYGVLSGTLEFLHTNAFTSSAMDLGVSGHASFTFSKELYSDLYLGLGLDGGFGTIDGVFQGGGALNFGFLHQPGTLGKLQNFRWGATLTGIGYRTGSQTRGYTNALGNNLTPAIGAAFEVVSKPSFQWTLRGDLRFPSFTDFWFGIGTDVRFGPARLSLGTTLDLRDAIQGEWKTLIPSISLSAHFPLGKEDPEAKQKTSRMGLEAAAAPLYADVWGFSLGAVLPFGVRDSNPPQITVDYGDLRYISPNYDGIQDELIIEYTADDERYITGYLWQVRDDDGNVVRTYQNKDERPENESIENLWTRITSPKQGTILPDVFRWDGVTDQGSSAPDGTYTVHMAFWDDNGNQGHVGPFGVVVDTVAPQLDLVVPEGLDLIFSPDGDGVKDVFSIRQDGSVETLWEARWSNAQGQPIKEYTWIKTKPSSFEWEGRDASATVVPDGVYSYWIGATDEAGNASEASIEGVIVDTRRPQPALSISRSVFSPLLTGDEAVVRIEPQIPVRSGIIEWEIDVRDQAGQSQKIWNRRLSPAVPDQVAFNGTNKDGRTLPEGEYYAHLSLEYQNGFRPEVTSPLFTIDMSAPEATVRANWNLFSPQSGSRRNTVDFIQTTTSEERWSGRLTNSEGTVMKEWSWVGEVPGRLEWDGRDAEGRLVADGTYFYVLESRDKAGNQGQSVPVSVTVDTQSVEASLTASLDVFAPTGNGINDEVTLFPLSVSDAEVGEWSLWILNSFEEEVRRWEGKGRPVDQLSWNGQDNAGATVLDGSYFAKLNIVYLKGDEAGAETGAIVVDTQAPRLEVEIPDGLFGPDGDGNKDRLFIRQKSTEEPSLESFILDEERMVRRRWLWSPQLENLVWDGRDDSGNLLPDGSYSYRVEAQDVAGNETVRELSNIVIDTAPRPVYLTASEAYLRSGETDPNRFQSFRAVVPNTSGAKKWIFRIQDSRGRAVWSEEGEGVPPQAFTWDGRAQDGTAVEGEFTGALEVEFAQGARPLATSRPFTADGSAPEVNLTISPRPFSPDGDNVDDEVVIGLQVEDQSRIQDWSFVIKDPRGDEFITFSGRGRPSERIIWDGRGGRGETVGSAEDYPYVLTVTDILGHKTVENGLIPVDVLVIREGDRLKIRINTINFSPSSPALTRAGDEGAKNAQVLDRLAQIMQKYGSYRIVVEGHAVMLNWNNPTAAQREQDEILVPLSMARAQTVVDELVSRGVQANRLTANGLGGSDPVVPHGNLDERWRNRRVEFYLEK
ncbi:MAG: OmpA family protein [Spirochaetales bacterium]|nr:OmpA family protein [Spirochaetales bacterium]